MAGCWSGCASVPGSLAGWVARGRSFSASCSTRSGMSPSSRFAPSACDTSVSDSRAPCNSLATEAHDVTLTAGQLVYTNVEKQHSSAGRDGYQVWLRSPDALGDGDETALMTRLGDFEARDVGEEPLARHLYFTLPSGRVVLARTVPLAETDRFSRAGRFYAHAVVIGANEFRKLGNDPFALLDQVTFQSSLEEGEQAGDAGKGTLPAILLGEREAKRDGMTLDRDQLSEVLPSLMRACGKEKPVFIGVAGTPSQVLRFARDLFAWLPPSLRLACNFDTLSTGRSLTQVPFAIVGLPAAGPTRRYLNLLIFDPACGEFTQPPPGTTPGLFDYWLLDHVRDSGEPPAEARSEAAYRLGSCLDRGVVVTSELADVDSSLFEEIATSNAGVTRLERLLRKRLDATLGSALSPVVFALAYNWLRSEGLDGLRVLGEPFPPLLLLRWLLSVYAQRAADEIDLDTEVPALKDVLEQTKGVEGEAAALRKRLVVLYYRFGRKWSALAKALRDTKMVPDDVYRWFVERALRRMPIRVIAGVGTNTGGAWCGPLIACTERANLDECQRLVAAILGIDPQDPAAEPLPRARWTWLLHHLMSQIEPGDL